MSNQPQCPIEEIELIPHPMDAWRAALNALIACAPGDGPAIAAHLAEAGEHALMYVNRAGATPGVAKMVDRLMLIGAGRIVGERLQTQTQTSIGSLNRRVTNRLTVVVNGTDYDVSNLPGVLVGDMIRVDPNNMPPVLNRECGFIGLPRIGSAFQSQPGQARDCADSSAAAGQPDGPSAPAQPDATAAAALRAPGSAPAAPAHSKRFLDAVAHSAPETPLADHPALPAAPQNSDRS